MTTEHPRLSPAGEAEHRRVMHGYRDAWRTHMGAFWSSPPNPPPEAIVVDRAPSPAAFAAVGDLAFGETAVGGVYAHGPTGSGKSCAVAACAWRTLTDNEAAKSRALLRHIAKLEELRAAWRREDEAEPSHRGRVADELHRLEVQKFQRDLDARSSRQWIQQAGKFSPLEFQFWTASDLKDSFADLARDIEGKRDLIAALTTAEVLWIDDFGHTLSPPFAESLRVILDRWQGGTLYLTSQYPLDALVARWARGEAQGMREQATALARRIEKLCARVRFSEPDDALKRRHPRQNHAGIHPPRPAPGLTVGPLV